MSQNGTHSNPPIRRAMLLSAGLGTRLRPLTLSVPKPLIPFGPYRLIDYNLSLLARAGITDVVINLHHLGEQIRAHVGDGSIYNLNVIYSEEPVILGTGGGIVNARPHFHDEPFLVMNGDILVNIDLEKVMQHHLRTSPAATMVIRAIAPHEDYTRLSFNSNGHITRFGEGQHMFIGIQVLSPRIFSILPEEGPSCLIKDGYEAMLRRDMLISTFVHKGYWNDVGTPARYTQSQHDVIMGQVPSPSRVIHAHHR